MEHFQGLFVMPTVVTNMDQLPFPSPKPSLQCGWPTAVPIAPPHARLHTQSSAPTASGVVPKLCRPNKPSCPTEWQPPAPNEERLQLW